MHQCSIVEEVLERITRLIRLLVDDFNVEAGDVLCTPVIIHALLDELVRTEFTALRVIHDVKLRAGPYVTNMFIAILRTLVLSNAQNEHGVSVVKLVFVEHGDWRVPLWVAVQFGLQQLL